MMIVKFLNFAIIQFDQQNFQQDFQISQQQRIVMIICLQKLIDQN